MILVFAVLFGVSMAEWYKVGDEAGWTNKGHVDYDAWAKSKIFRVGDTIRMLLTFCLFVWLCKSCFVRRKNAWN